MAGRACFVCLSPHCKTPSAGKSVTQGAQSGMLLEYDPSTGETRCLMDGLWFSNGVAMPSDGSFVLVNETLKLRVWRLWLTGPKV